MSRYLRLRCCHENLQGAWVGLLDDRGDGMGMIEW